MKAKAFIKNIIPQLRAHYHWITAILVLLMIFFHGGAANNLNSLHIVPITEELNIPRSSYSLAISTKGIVSAIMTFFSGFFFARFGFRKMAVFGMTATGIAYLILSGATGIASIFLGGMLLGIAGGFCSTAGASRIVSDWFHKYKGTMLGLVTSASGFGGSVMCLVQSAIIEAFSWRASLITAAVCILFICLLILIFIRNKPVEKGLVPLGEGEEVIGKRRKSVENISEGLPMKSLWKKPAFLLMCLATFCSGSGLYLAFSVIVAYLKGECAFPAATASGLQSFMLLFLTFTKLACGYLCDTVGVRKTTVFCHLCSMASLLLLPFISNTPIAVVTIVFYTCGLPLVTIMPPLLSLVTFGYRAQPQYTGIFLGVIAGSNFVADFVSNLIFDTVNSYKPAFFLGAGASLAALVLLFFVFRLHDREEKKAEA